MEARAACQRLAADLVVIETLEENEFIKSYVRTVVPNSKFMSAIQYSIFFHFLHFLFMGLLFTIQYVM